MALAAGDPAPSRQVLRTQVLRLIDSIIDQQLLVAAATADGFAPRPVAARQTLGDLEKQMGAEAFQRKLQQQGMPLETIVQRMADAKAVGEWVENKVLSTVAVPDEEARAYYEARLGEYQAPERLRVSHILVRTSARDPEAKRREARRKAEDLLSRARAGADFALLARENSDCPSKSNGGDLGFFTRGHLPAGLETAAEALKPGELSGIVETTLGLHIVLGGERKAAATRPFQAEKARIVETLRQEKVKRTLRGIAAAAREKVEVRVLVPEDG
jgi:peptidyl-prolyl cis-trans isomerase C